MQLPLKTSVVQERLIFVVAWRVLNIEKGTTNIELSKTNSLNIRNSLIPVHDSQSSFLSRATGMFNCSRYFATVRLAML